MIECVWFDAPPEGPWEPGWCFPDPYGSRQGWMGLSKRYLEHDAAHRPPICVTVPMHGDESWEAAHPGQRRGTWFGIDCHPTDKPDEAWNVEIVDALVHGTKPDITVTPSMHAVGIYHGWLTNGVLSDDLGG